MSFGMRIWAGDGALQIDENSFTMRVVLSVLVNIPNGVQTYQEYAVPGITPGNGSAVVVPIGAYSDSATQYETEVLNGVVRVYNYIRGFVGTYTSVAGTMRLLVMRFS